MTSTIVAVSSPPIGIANPAAGATLPLAIVRLSGPSAVSFADRVFKLDVPETSHRPASLIPRRSDKLARKIPTTLIEAASEKRWRRVAGRVCWRALDVKAHAYIMPSPKSYTREDVVELHVPGLPWLVEELLDGLIAAGARPAQPGEFTRRAFENGRITLEQAQAVGQLIACASAAEARAHAARLAAHAGVARRKLKADLEDLLAKVELGLDFAHEDVVVISLEDIAARLEELRARAEKLAEESARESERMAHSRAPRIVLAGPTNAGKSRLFNALLNRDAAIVSAERHTTRDAVEAELKFGDVSAMLVDSAGSGDGEVGETGRGGDGEKLLAATWQATRRALATGDIVVLALDCSVSLNSQDGLTELLTELKPLKPAAAAIVWTKCDLAAAPDWRVNVPLDFDAPQRFEVSAISNQGVDALRGFLGEKTAELSARTAEAHAAAGAALRAAAREAAEALARGAEALRDGCGEDVVAVELREAIHAFWRAEGILMRHDAVTEAALDVIFSEFCIGK